MENEAFLRLNYLCLVVIVLQDLWWVNVTRNVARSVGGNQEKTTKLAPQKAYQGLIYLRAESFEGSRGES